MRTHAGVYVDANPCQDKWLTTWPQLKAWACKLMAMTCKDPAAVMRIKQQADSLLKEQASYEKAPSVLCWLLVGLVA